MVDVVHARREQRGARLDGREHGVQRRRVEQHVRGLRHVSGVQRVVEGVVAHVVLLQRDGEGEERAGRDLQRAQQLPGRERGVRDSCQGSSAGQVTDAEDVHAPPLDLTQLTTKVFLVRSIYSVSWHALTSEAISVRQCALNARYL